MGLGQVCSQAGQRGYPVVLGCFKRGLLAAKKILNRLIAFPLGRLQ